MVLPSDDAAESFTRPEQIMNTPLGGCPSTNRNAPFGYVALEVIADNFCMPVDDKSQKILSSRKGQAMQSSIIRNPYGVCMEIGCKYMPKSQNISSYILS
jgi:hypothetical protein